MEGHKQRACRPRQQCGKACGHPGKDGRDREHRERL